MTTNQPQPQPQSQEDPLNFDEILNLEEESYQKGYDEGMQAGSEAGRLEGYSLGLVKGFEKFVEAGRLQSKAVVWANRIPKYQQRKKQQQEESPTSEKEEENETGKEKETKNENKTTTLLPNIQSNPRLEKNIELLYGLVEPGTLSTKNDDEAVNDFDSRMKGAQGKLRIIERAVGEGSSSSRNATTTSGKNENIEDVGSIRPQPQPQVEI